MGIHYSLLLVILTGEFEKETEMEETGKEHGT